MSEDTTEAARERAKVSTRGGRDVSPAREVRGADDARQVSTRVSYVP